MENALYNGWALPAVGLDFQDVTQVFVEASGELDPEILVFLDKFQLQDAMSALEIGEPRLDSGIISQEQKRPPFDPLMPLLPEEVCWILDRALAYETEFHAGNFLAHTVHTLLYVHHLFDIEVDMTLSLPSGSRDPTRPLELVTVVLRSAVLGLLKSCDMAWRELAKGGAYDTEDWQSDKCEVSLLEGTPVTFVVSKLDEAVAWLESSELVQPHWKLALQSRLLFRKAFLQALCTQPTKNRVELQYLIDFARYHLNIVEARPAPDFPPGFPAQDAFDPYVGRRLQMATPIRVVTPPTFEDTCKSIRHFLEGLYEVSQLSGVETLTTWAAVGDLRLWIIDPLSRAPFIRSLAQSTFYDGILIFNKYSFAWMVNQFFLETFGITYDSVRVLVSDNWNGPEQPPLKPLEHCLYKLITPYMRGFWHNPPRRRRQFMKLIPEWHTLHGVLEDILLNLNIKNDLAHGPIRCLTSVALLPRYSIIREIVLSGFQLELYSTQEKSFAYFYASEVLGSHVGELEDLMLVLDSGTPIYHETLYQLQFLEGLKAICHALFLACMPLASFDWRQVRDSHYRRYKWAFPKDSANFEREPPTNPDICRFSVACDEPLKDGQKLPSESIEFAHRLFSELAVSDNIGGWIGLWAPDRRQFLRGLVTVCEGLQGVPTNSEELETFDARRLRWDTNVHPWFPSLVPDAMAVTT